MDFPLTSLTCTGIRDTGKHGTDRLSLSRYTTRSPLVYRSSCLVRWCDDVWRVPCFRIPTSAIPWPSVRSAVPIQVRTLSSRRRMYHPVGIYCLREQRYSAFASQPTMDRHVRPASPTYLSDPFLVMSGKDSRRPSDDVISDELMKTVVLFVEERK